MFSFIWWISNSCPLFNFVFFPLISEIPGYLAVKYCSMFTSYLLTQCLHRGRFSVAHLRSVRLNSFVTILIDLTVYTGRYTCTNGSCVIFLSFKPIFLCYQSRNILFHSSGDLHFILYLHCAWTPPLVQTQVLVAHPPPSPSCKIGA